ncbi:hypothetical protein ABZU76_08540 [Amycolatopsis sp. NPDC005232]|uniref:helix-turn-helix domain-containing protein n=1 Tax=Amycolatopsis sp. NPDC005232 TaxID=3157027 RepID=UPI0033BC9A54
MSPDSNAGGLFHDLDPAQARTPEVFTHLLRQVRSRAGHSYARIERFGSPDVPLSKGTLSGIFGGKRLPSVDQLETILTGCGVPTNEIPAWIKVLVHLKSTEHDRTRGYPAQAQIESRPEDAERLAERRAELGLLLKAEEAKVRHLSQYVDLLRQEPNQAQTVKQLEARLDRERSHRAELVAEFEAASAHLAAMVDDGRHLDVRGARRCPLPPTDRIFTGRDALVNSIGTPDLLWLSGRPGAGTSQVAIHWAHQVASSYQYVLYMDLQGMSPGRRVSAREAARELIGALSRGPVEQVDDDKQLFEMLQARLGSTTALVVLDNARNAAHVEPLLKVAGAGTTVVVTSRHRRQAFTQAAIHVPVLARADAVTILAGFAPGAETAVLDTIADLCDDLPLALRIVAGLIVGKPQLVAAIARNLADERERLNHLTTDQQAVRSAIVLSYQSLDNGAQRVARRLAVSFAAMNDAAEMAVGLDTEEIPTTLELLRVVDASLAEVAVDGDQLTYSLPPLIWLALAERSSGEDTPASVSSYRMRTARYVADLAIKVAEAAGTVADVARARVVLEAAVSSQWWEIAEDLALALRRLLGSGYSQERTEITEVLIRIYLADGRSELAINASLDIAKELQDGTYDRVAAREWAERAGAFAEHYELPRSQIKAGMVLSQILAGQNDFQAALRVAEGLLPLAERHLVLGERHNPLFNVVRLYAMCGNHIAAKEYLQRLVRISELAGDSQNRAEAYFYLGDALFKLDEVANAGILYGKAAEYWAATGQHQSAAVAHERIADLTTDPDERIAAQKEAVANWRMTGDGGRLVGALVDLGALYYVAGRLDDVEHVLGHADVATGTSPELDHEVTVRMAALAMLRGRPSSPPPVWTSAHELVADACLSMKTTDDTLSPDRLLRHRVLHPVPDSPFWLYDDSWMPKNLNVLEA